jgi:DNA topoisomerase-1
MICMLLCTGRQALEPAKKNIKWWTQAKRADDIKWDSLVHNGVIFPPPYEPLPAHVKLIYDKQPVDLAPEVEECAVWYVDR